MCAWATGGSEAGHVALQRCPWAEGRREGGSSWLQACWGPSCPRKEGTEGSGPARWGPQDAPTPWDPERRQESVGTGGGAGAAAPCRAAAGGLVKMSPCDLLPVRPSALTYLVFI